MSMIKNHFHRFTESNMEDYITLPLAVQTFIGDSFNLIDIHGNPNVANFFTFSHWDEGSRLDCFTNENELCIFLTFKLNRSQHDGFSSVIFDKNGTQLQIAVSSISFISQNELKAA